MILQPELVYRDRDALCRYAAGYLRSVTGDAVAYTASGDSSAPALRFRDAQGAEETDAAAWFAVRAQAPGSRLGYWLYTRVPLFAWLSAALFAWCSRHPRAALWLGHELVGRKWRATRFAATSALFLRALGALYVLAFASFGFQARGLIGDNGILPVAQYLHQAWSVDAAAAFWQVPTLLWLYPHDALIVALCALGVGGGVALVLGARRRWLLLAQWVFYLSLVSAGQVFMHYQWDSLLLEVGFLAFLLPGSARLVPWLYRLFLLRFLFLAGLMKLTGSDVAWRSLHALDHYFMTQPLPAGLAWQAAHLPEFVLRFLTACILFIQLVLPWFILLPRHLRMLAAWALIALEAGFAVTGAYGFMPLLVAATVLFLFDDQALETIARRLRVSPLALANSRTWQRPRVMFAVLVLVLGLAQSVGVFAGRTPVAALTRVFAPFQIANVYSLLRDMPARRYEVEIQGSDDNRTWKTYQFAAKPGAARGLAIWWPFAMPRLDWQMAYAARTPFAQNPWFLHLVMRLLHGSAPVQRLFAHAPFADKPPRLVRAQLFEYRFVPPALHSRTGTWWERRFVRSYLAPAMLSSSHKASDGRR